MYDLTKDPLTHYDHLTFARRVGRAHVAMHEALEQDEPNDWCVDCDVCGVRAAHESNDVAINPSVLDKIRDRKIQKEIRNTIQRYQSSVVSEVKDIRRQPTPQAPI